MLLLCTFLSLPSYFLFWSARSHLNPSDDFDEMILALSLGSLGEEESSLIELDIKEEQQHVEMFCETGVIGRVTRFGIAMVEEEDNKVDYVENSFCDLTIPTSFNN